MSDERDPQEVSHVLERLAASLRQEPYDPEQITAWGLSIAHVGWVLDNIGMIELLADEVASTSDAAAFKHHALGGLPPRLVVAYDDVELPRDQVESTAAAVVSRIADVLPEYADDLTEDVPGDTSEARRRWLAEAFAQVIAYRERDVLAATERAMERASEAGYAPDAAGFTSYVLSQAGPDSDPTSSAVPPRSEPSVAGVEVVRLADSADVVIDIADLSLVSTGGESAERAVEDPQTFRWIRVLAAAQAARRLDDLTTVGELLLQMQVADAYQHLQERGVASSTLASSWIEAARRAAASVRNDDRLAPLGACLLHGDKGLVAQVLEAAGRLGLRNMLDEARAAGSLSDEEISELFERQLLAADHDLGDATRLAWEAAVDQRRGIRADRTWQLAALRFAELGASDSADRCRQLVGSWSARLQVRTWDSLEVAQW